MRVTLASVAVSHECLGVVRPCSCLQPSRGQASDTGKVRWQLPVKLQIQVPLPRRASPLCGGVVAIAGEWGGAHTWEEDGRMAGNSREGWEKMSGNFWALSLVDISWAPTLESFSDVPKIDLVALNKPQSTLLHFQLLKFYNNSDTLGKPARVMQTPLFIQAITFYFTTFQTRQIYQLV